LALYGIYPNAFGTIFCTGAHTSQALIGNSSTPTITAGTGAGTVPTLAITGNNMAGWVVNTTGSSPVGNNATISTITYANGVSYPHGSAVILEPLNFQAASIVGASGVYASGTTSSFLIISGLLPLKAATSYSWNYQVVGY